MSKLGEICEIVSGSTPKTDNEEFWNGEYCWITPAEISDNDTIIYDTERKITEAGAKSCSLTLMPVGTVLLSCRAPIGKVAIIGNEMYCNQGFKNLICSDVIFNKYLFWFLRNNTAFLNSLGRGATFKEISKKIVAEIEIPLPPLETQRQIAENLDKVTHLIDLCNQMLDKLDLLVKSRFTEMFGDVNLNSKNFDCFYGKDLFKFCSGKFLPEEKRTLSGVPVYGGNGIAWYTDSALIDYPTIIIGRVGAWCGNIHKTSEPVWITDNAIYIKENKSEKLILSFLEHLMVVMKFQQYADFSGQPKITQKPLENLCYIVPPIELQTQFAEFVQSVDKSKLEVKQLLEKAEMLKKSLMQEYFSPQKGAFPHET